MRWLIGMCIGLFIGVFNTAYAQTSIQVTSDNFELVGEIEPSEAIEMVSELERFRSSLLEIYNLPASTPDVNVPIYIVSDSDIFSILNVPKDFVAVYSDTKIGPQVLVNGKAIEDDPTQLQHILRHEYVHHFIHMNHPSVSPRWLSEGLAEYYAGYEELSDNSYRVGSGLENNKVALTYAQHGWYPLVKKLRNYNDIERHFPIKYIAPPAGWSRAPDDISMFYSQSWALVHYMINQPGGLEKLDKIAERFMALDGGNSEIKQPETYKEYMEQRESMPDEFVTAVKDILGQSPDDLNLILQSYAEGDMPLQTFQVKEGRKPFTIEVGNLSSAEAAARQYRIMSISASGATINDKMKDMRSNLEMDPQQALSLMVSDAAQQSNLGFPVKALEIIENALKLDPNIRDGQLLKTQIEYEQFANGNFYQYEKMRETLRPALAASPYNVQLLTQMVTTGITKPGDPSEDVDQALAKVNALNLIRRNPLKAANLINFYVAKKDYTQALYILRRVKPFLGSNQFNLHRLEEDLESVIAEQ